MKRFRRKKIIITALTALALFAAAVVLIAAVKNASSILLKTASATAKSAADSAANDAVFSTIGGVSYGDFVSIERDDNGKILSITSNAAAVNKTARRIVALTEELFDGIISRGAEIPIGAFTGISFFSGVGAKIKVGVNAVCAVECKFVSSFETAGINQTKHSIYLIVVEDVTVATFNYTDNFAVSSQTLICESVIVGEIPEIYMQSGTLSEKFNLVP